MSSNPDTDVYTVGKNLLVAHSLAYKTYNDNYKTSQGGLVSFHYIEQNITINLTNARSFLKTKTKYNICSSNF